MRNSRHQIESFIKDARAEDNSGNFEGWVSDNQIAKNLKSARHLRGQRVARDMSKEANGIPVDALYFDQIGNVIALCKDGYVRQYIR